MRRAALTLTASTMIVTTSCGLVMTNPPRQSQFAARSGCPEAVHLPTPPIPATPPPLGVPEAVSKASPVYPDIARQANVDGTVVAWVLVCEHGNVRDVQIVKSFAMLDASAMTAFRQWKFRPAVRDGGPVPMWAQLPMKFTLN